MSRLLLVSAVIMMLSGCAVKSYTDVNHNRQHMFYLWGKGYVGTVQGLPERRAK